MGNLSVLHWRGLTAKGTEVIRKSKSNRIKNVIKSSIPKDKVDNKEIRVLIVEFVEIYLSSGPFFLALDIIHT